MKRVTALIICVLMIIGLTACRGKDKAQESESSSDMQSIISSDTESSQEDSSTETVTDTSSTGSQTSGSKNKVVNNCNVKGFPLAEKTVTLNVMIKDYSGLTSYKNMAINKYFADKLNVKINWTVVPGGADVNTQAQLAYQSGKLPDIFLGMEPLGYNFHWQYIQQGYIKQLDSYINEYAPNVVKMFKEVPQARYQCTAPDGKIYMLPIVDSRTENTGKYADLMFINKTWLSRVGKKVPTNMNELKDVLKAFRDRDANGNGITTDEIPMMMVSDVPNGYFGAFGMSVYNELMYVDNSRKVKYAPVENAYKNALIFLNNLYKEKLVNNDIYMQDQNGLSKAVTAGTVGVFYGSNLVSIASEARASEYAVLAPLNGPNGEKGTYTCQTTEMIWPGWMLITSKCKYPEIAVRLADYLYSVEGSYVSQYGPPGANNAWNYNSKGKVVLSGKLTDPSFKYKFTPGWPMPAWLSDEFISAQYQKPVSQMTKAEKINDQVNKDALKLYEPKMPKYKLEKASYTESEIKISNRVLPDILSQGYKMRKEFVTEGNIEAKWDTYIKQMKQLKVDDYIKLSNDAYQRYVTWEKANVK